VRLFVAVRPPPDGKVDGTVAMVDRRLRGHHPCQLAFRGAGAFTRRALWLGVDGELAALSAMARSVTFERRPYRPHLTVARLRGGSDAGPAVQSLTAYDGPLWTASTVHLVQSHLGPSPTYDDVATWPLAQRA
jgi:2'-5' RNA ligase